MTENLYRDKIVLVPCRVKDCKMRFNGESDSVELTALVNEHWMNHIITPKTLILEPTEEQLIEIERYGI